MRLWSLHPKYLDSKGLVALWREGLLAKAVLEGKTKGYTHHPQLKRFREHPDPLCAIQAYLLVVWDEATRRGYRFDSRKVDRAYGGLDHGEGFNVSPIPLTTGQLEYEWNHLLNKLRTRDPERCHSLESLNKIEPHPLMTLIPGPIAPWEIAR